MRRNPVFVKLTEWEHWPTFMFYLPLLPFFFIYAPITLLRPDAGLWDSIIQSIAILMLILSLQIGVSSFCFTRLRIPETTAFIIASIFALLAVFTRNNLLFWIGLALFLISVVNQYLFQRRIGREE